ncbi:hypothetical protein COCSADRAFT_268339 [Bipolaris sorokiniana ND90Pr]|uniref:Uncharacterized protein n=1 Tax=Cochliobolus sativus (strain ND90Pr / ATCC 201652) TaxID=665912 RepID=M2RN52_COCSN|nr:uncharacterized protein COCSADRAFT_268339 [Bipolaris sorokiniana ND90Pr]XP_007697676.1 uncharacterized protein COCSADRAFT_353147 [Bipolaris sorokiniana ND90Pr]EMD66094.1 hypothetical protein COCSADRAFT_353147 [Bipolaris sorokiniana ND90Pr]EMD68059.1 hypothetical protein COCSADRAFT_268339 [Bipolaris sorokiniana ND90Pr]
MSSTTVELVGDTPPLPVQYQAITSPRITYKTHSFYPMEKMLPEKDLRRISVDNGLLALHEMMHSVTTCILYIRCQATSDRRLADFPY